MKPEVEKGKKVDSFLRWLPMTASVGLLITISVVSALSFAKLNTSNLGRQRANEVLATAQTLLSDLFNIQAQARDYVFTGQPLDL